MATEPIKQIVHKELNQTPVQELADTDPLAQHENNDNSSSNDPNAKHKKRKRRHKRVKHHKDPEQIKELKLQKIKIKRQGLWNNRFINDTIPDIYNRPKKRKSQLFRRNKSPLETVYMDKDVNKEHKLPHLTNKQNNRESGEKQTQKSFNIRTVTAKNQNFKKPKKAAAKSQQRQDKTKPEPKIQNSEKTQQAVKKDNLLNGEGKLHQPQHSKEKSKLLFKLQQKTKIHQINQGYKALLVDLIALQSTKKSKQLRIMLDNQIASIGQEKNAYTRIQGMIKQRKGLLKSIKEVGQSTTLRTLISLQITSVGLIEEILKFKAKWEQQYYKLDKPKKVSYIYEGKNYLLLMKQEVKQLQPECDPFLVSRTSKLQVLVGGGLREEEIQEKKQIMLKMRACELLLIQEELTQERQ